MQNNEVWEALRALGWAISNYCDGAGDEQKLRVAQKKAYEVQKKHTPKEELPATSRASHYS